MMLRYLLDTNILSDVIKNPSGSAANYMISLNKEMINTSIIVASEMRYGIEKKNSLVLTERVNVLLQTIHVLPFDIDADRFYGKIRANLEQQGKMIGANDLLIAAHALSINAILVTDNIREFQRIDGLIIENWLEGQCHRSQK